MNSYFIVVDEYTENGPGTCTHPKLINMNSIKTVDRCFYSNSGQYIEYIEIDLVDANFLIQVRGTLDSFINKIEKGGFLIK